MAKGFKHGAGGVSALNFKIVGGAIQPENPKENTIWVNTETEISGWVFSAEEPGEPAEGMVWIELGTASPAPFKALKKDSVYVHPISCRQYQGGAWTNVDAYLYTGSEWVQFSSEIKYLYRNGETSITWTGTGTDTDTELLMEITHTIYNGGYGDYGRKYSSKPINIPTGFTKLSIKYYCTGTKQTEGTPTHAFVLRTDLASGTWMSETNVVASVSIPYTTAETVATMDVSGSLYGKDLYCGTYYNSHKNVTNPKQYHIKEIWFE